MMAGRVLRLGNLEYDEAVWGGVNESGYDPLDDKVLVLTDTHVGVTAGGVHIAAETIERQTMAAEHGTVIAVGPAAFRFNDQGTRSWAGIVPEPGDRVYFERYGGQLLKGVDGRLYRLMSQRCIGAIAPARKKEDQDVGAESGSA